MNKKLLTVTIAGAIATPMAAQAIKYKISGQVSRSIIYYDDGVQSDIRNVDNSESGTRFRFRGSEDLGNGMKVGLYYEMQTSSAPAADARPDADNPRNADDLGIRFANVWFSGNWGKLSLGQNDGAGNTYTEIDLSGTDVSGTYASKNDLTSGLPWRSSAPGGAQITNAAGTPLNEGNTYNNYDAFSRYDNVRYDSPALGPVVLSASAGNDQVWEVAGRLKTALGGGQLSGGAFYGQDTGVGSADPRWGGSVSYLFSQGINITGHYAHNESESGGTNSDTFGARLGYKWGANAISLGYAQGQDVAGNGFDDTGVNVGFVHSLRKVNTQLYAAFLYSELDTPAGTPSAKDHNTFLVGARVKFD